ncbi:hypothetical protein [Haloplasma contractile]|uniref:Uncharacterized protein n=1 Tax=Haloplasma contractile SSD-17B TaxID=1033810 RepID=F7Q115_9MOLU|nr:hypothetical protein [Haloplasma contractile]ERJ11342.1 hypothetical protein HLPCO_002644 [Haloplasma contractile SSD-17B]
MNRVVWFFITTALVTYKRLIVILPTVIIVAFLITYLTRRDDVIFAININRENKDIEFTLVSAKRTASIPRLNLRNIDNYNNFKDLKQTVTLPRNKGEYRSYLFDDDYIKVKNRNDLVNYLGFSKLEAEGITEDEFLEYTEFNIMDTTTSSVSDEEKTLTTTTVLLGSEDWYQETSLYVRVTITWNEIPENRGIGYLGISLPKELRYKTKYNILPFEDHILRSRNVYKEDDKVKIEQSSEDYLYNRDDLIAKIELPKQNITELHQSVEYNLMGDNHDYHLLDLNEIQVLGHYTHINKDYKESLFSFADISNGMGIKYRPYDVYKSNKPISIVTTFNIDQFIFNHKWEGIVDQYDFKSFDGNNTSGSASYLYESGNVYATLHDSEDVDFYKFIAYEECSLTITLENIPEAKNYRFDIVDQDGNGIYGNESLGQSKIAHIDQYTHEEKQLYIKVYSTDGSYDMHQRYLLSIEKRLDD